MSDQVKKLKTFGSVVRRKPKDGEENAGVYIKISQDISLKKGDIVNVEDPRTLPDRLLERGVISQERYEEMKLKADATPDFVLNNLTIKQ